MLTPERTWIINLVKMTADNRLGKDTLQDSSLWHEVGIYHGSNLAEYPVALEFNGMRVRGAVYVSNGKKKMETFLTIPLDGGDKLIPGNLQDLLAEQAKVCLTEGLKLNRKELNDVKLSGTNFGAACYFTLTLEGDPWKAWDRSKQSFDRRARGFAQTLVNRINRGEDQPLVRIAPQSA